MRPRWQTSEFWITLVALALLLIPGLAPAQQPSHQPTCFFAWRHRQSDPAMMQLLQQISNQQQQIIQLLIHNQQHQLAPQPQVIVLGPQQQIPFGTMPYQQIPLGGPPRQDIPLGGPPRQDIPLGSPPHQDIPLGPPHRQDIPLGPSQPQQQIPPGDVKPGPRDQPPLAPKVPLAYQRYTQQRTEQWNGSRMFEHNLPRK